MTENVSTAALGSVISSPPRARGKRSSQDAMATQEAILDAALLLFAERGYDGTSLRDIAANVGISHGIIRHHFGSKMAIWEMVATKVFEFFRSSLLPLTEVAIENSAADSGEEAFQAFQTLVSTFIRISLDKPEYARLFVQETRQENERSRFCADQFMALHNAIGELFLEAQTSSKILTKYTNDSFFYALLSLTYFKILHPTLGARSISAEVENQEMHDFIVSVLFH
jgi:TetR/AcrR family transcriptional regulator